MLKNYVLDSNHFILLFIQIQAIKLKSKFIQFSPLLKVETSKKPFGRVVERF